MEIQIEMLPTEERDRALGRYMDAFSRMEGLLDHLIQTMVGTDWRAAGALSAALYSKQRIDLLESLAWVRLSQDLAGKVTKLCARIARRNMRRNHIIHGTWVQFVTIHDDRYEMAWVRKYTPTDPELAVIQDLDSPKLLGTYTFTIPALDKATGHVEEVLSALSALVSDIREQSPQAPASSEESPK